MDEIANINMSCFSPIKAYKGQEKIPGKSNLMFSRTGSWRGVSLYLPCGQCVGCRLERSRQWAVRCMHEASLYQRNSFITLTYDNEHLPKNGSLVLSHFQDFMKRLRKKYGSGIRFYHCGEYGEALGRPHYHALLFNHDFEDKKLYTKSNGNSLYSSESLSSLWPAGFSLIGDVTFDSAAYVARYVMKKVTGVNKTMHYRDKLPEYTTMSRRPGIGTGWYKKFKDDVYPADEVVTNGVSCKPPRFYDNLLAKEDRSMFELLKIQREKEGNRMVLDVINGKPVLVSDNDSFRLPVHEEVKLRQISALKRPLEVPS